MCYVWQNRYLNGIRINIDENIICFLACMCFFGVKGGDWVEKRELHDS